MDDISGLYDHGVRNRNPITAVWYGIDELFEKYPENGPYGYCGGDPVKYFDPNGRELELSEVLLLDLLKQSIPEHMRKYVSIDDDGLVDNDLLQKGLLLEKNYGINYQSLCDISADSRRVVVSLNDDIEVYYKNGERVPKDKLPYNFRDPISDEYNNYTPELVGYVGASYSPKNHQWEEKDEKLFNEREIQLYTKGNFYSVQLNGRGKQFRSVYRTYVVILAHELFGHIKFMLNGKSALHYPEARSGEASNVELENHIRESVDEADKNCNY